MHVLAFAGHGRKLPAETVVKNETAPQLIRIKLPAPAVAASTLPPVLRAVDAIPGVAEARQDIAALV